jgi:serine/threonine protein kinase
MPSPELEAIVRQLRAVRTPEALFGDLHGGPDDMIAQAKRTFRRLAQQVHPDTRPLKTDEALANEGFILLNRLWEQAQVKIQEGSYGQPVTIATARRSYTLGKSLGSGDLCEVYQCTYREEGQLHTGILKITRDSADNDLVVNEAAILRRLAKGDPDERFVGFLPHIVEAFHYRDSGSAPVLAVNVLSLVDEIRSPGDLYSLEEVMAQYPEGIDPRDMAWMWRHLLTILGFAHQGKIIHGAVLPPHILIHPQMHGLVLIDWAYALDDPTDSGEYVRAVCPAYESWYPAEVWEKESPLPTLDIFMGARTMIALLGGDPVKGTLPKSIPARFKRYFEWCTLPGARQRPQQAWKLLEEFDTLLEAEWGKRRFREFHMPKRDGR